VPLPVEQERLSSPLHLSAHGCGGFTPASSHCALLLDGRATAHCPREARRWVALLRRQGDVATPPLARLAAAPTAALDGYIVRTPPPLFHEKGGELRSPR
jgi:hypothetical protein